MNDVTDISAETKHWSCTHRNTLTFTLTGRSISAVSVMFAFALLSSWAEGIFQGTQIPPVHRIVAASAFTPG